MNLEDFLSKEPGAAALESLPCSGNAQTVLTFYITAKCNLQCAYCYEPKAAIPPDMTLGQIELSIDKFLLLRGAPAAIVIFGGEPSLRWDLARAIMSIRERRVLLHNARLILFTNGIGLTVPMALELIERNVEVFLSFDGYGASSTMRFGKALRPCLQKMGSLFHTLSSAPELTTIVFSVGNHNVRGVVSDIKLLTMRYGFVRYKINNIHNNRFSAETLLANTTRRDLREWARTKGNIVVDWDPLDTFGSIYENWYFSSERVSIQPSNVLGSWNNVRW